MDAITNKQQLQRLLLERQGGLVSSSRRAFRTGIEALDQLAPRGGFQNGAVHELLWKRQARAPTSMALLLARAAMAPAGAIVWSDPQRQLHAPAVAAMGIDLRRLTVLRCPRRQERLWALSECLRCPGVGATVATIEQLSLVEARRMQLAAERGGGVGIFMRPYQAAMQSHYAAATRWLVQPAPGTLDFQRWSVELVHGHGPIGQVIWLEVHRETHALRAFSSVADRSAAPAPTRATA